MRSLFVSALLAAAPAFADSADVIDAAQSGNFLPFSVSPSTSSSYATLMGGYDAGRGGAVVAAQLQLHLHERFYVALVGAYEGPDGSTLEPQVTGQAILVEEQHHGLDLAVAFGWEHQGFNGVPDGVGRVVIGRHVGGAYLFASTALGFAYSDSERYGEITLAGIGKVAPHLYFGVDTRAQKDLQHDTDPATEDAWVVQAGPAASYLVGSFAFSAVAGVSALRQHRATDDRIGALTLLGVAAAF